MGAAEKSAKAFPTAEGFGAAAVGGRGGRVIEVTDLEDSGPGSLRAAMEASGPRIVVFRVSGTITLTSAIRVSTHLVNQAQYDAGKPFAAPPVAMDAVSNLLEKVLEKVGAFGPFRDPVDRRVVQSVRDGTGTSRVSTTGPWPDLAAGAPAPPADSDHDGMPDAWEKAHGLDPHDARDGATVAANGYTNVENYLNELAGDPIP
jgi:hypothetical protein